MKVIGSVDTMPSIVRAALDKRQKIHKPAGFDPFDSRKDQQTGMRAESATGAVYREWH